MEREWILNFLTKYKSQLVGAFKFRYAYIFFKLLILRRLWIVVIKCLEFSFFNHKKRNLNIKLSFFITPSFIYFWGVLKEIFLNFVHILLRKFDLTIRNI